ncbi:PREDICTED: uncharacterized protein LOC107067858 [Polistes dominula]|uniref:Uncharacterized protein LOC107067858 n=1 Tax=Polistes dominula TaxID=743375 RepID=A0ABM1IG98_POLDO|nr:PREDICTED: uncharacterized protein LOC107067858 [Polistes dominula]
MNYDFYLTHMFIKRRGEFYGRIDDAEFNIKLQMNLENYHITLQELKILSISSFNLKIQGNKSDPILNILARALSRFFENSIIKLIENSGLELFSPLIKSLNQKLGKSKSKVNNFIDAL